MKKKLTMCAACFVMLGIFLYVGFDTQNALMAQDMRCASHTAIRQSVESTVLLEQDILINGLWIKEHWYSEEEYWVSLYQKASGETVIRVSGPQEKDIILQEVPVSLPGEILEISGFFAADHGGIPDGDDSLTDSGSETTDRGDEPDIRVVGPDVVISCRDEAGNGIRKFLYLWDGKARALDADPVEIPADHVPESITLRIFSRIQQEGPVSRKTLYQVDEQTKNIVELRSYTLNREEKTLEIRDGLRQRILFSGSVLLDEDGNLQNEAYFDCFFGSCSYVTSPWEPDPNIGYEEGIPVFVAEHDKYGRIENHTVYYPDREALLAEQGFSGQEPFFRYTDALGDLVAELYFDPATETGCGFYYDYAFYPEQEQIVTGYVFHGIEEQAWKQYSPYLLKNRYGETGKEWLDGGDVLSYEEDCRYRADGRPEYFCAGGLADFYGNGPEETVYLELDFIYRDDGTLACRKYSHNTWIWGTSYSSGVYLYDEAERLTYENLYVTHGGMSFYYIYEDGSDQPVYALMLDNCGTWGCGLFRVE